MYSTRPVKVPQKKNSEPGKKKEGSVGRDQKLEERRKRLSEGRECSANRIDNHWGNGSEKNDVGGSGVRKRPASVGESQVPKERAERKSKGDSA